MTYREAIQKQIDNTEKIYDNAGGLRDWASGNVEKDAWNKTRELTRELSLVLQRLDNKLPADRANMKVNQYD